MSSLLQDIIEHKHKEVELLNPQKLQRDLTQMHTKHKVKSFKQALSGDQLAFIGEIKRKSPSKGRLSLITDPIALLDEYIAGDIAAVSVLTDHKYFAGSIDDLTNIANYLKDTHTPVLRKEFIIDHKQIAESIIAGANAILLIVTVLKEKTKDLFHYAQQLGLEAIIEVHTKEELALAIDCGADMIAVNNRNLHTFTQDINVCLQLSPLIPDGIIKIAASAIKSAADIKQISDAGFDAVLIGETLVTSKEPAKELAKLRALL